MVGVNSIHRFIRLGLPRQLLIAEAVVLLAASAAAVAFLPFKTSVRLGSRSLGQARPKADFVPQACWSVRAAASRVPWRAMCFERGLALQWMLRRRGFDARLAYGARLQDSDALDAHVWVLLNDEIVIGGEQAETYRRLATHPEFRP